jgi:hypothetical protein
MTVETDAPKTFFVEPDPHVISEDFLEKAFLLGYECYSIPRHFVRNLPEKIPALLERFPSILLFLSHDHDHLPDGFREYYQSLQARADQSKRVGILLSPFVSEATADEVRQISLFEVGMAGGCVDMLTSASKSQERILQVLHHSEAQGRRKVIRWMAHASDVVTFRTAAGTRSEQLWDISISHFSVVLKNSPSDWQVGTRLDDVSLRFSGSLLFVSAVVAVKRVIAEGTLMVFVFHEDNDEARLRQRQSKVNSCIFTQHQKSTMQEVQNLFVGEQSAGAYI